mmetsp:Transcript_27098/g.48895  ORF Transcript_27098/g.48895 Transcript_27098/m.48895 type:complete len:111 (-) Transcript_27098:141-473(-)
MIGHIAFNNQCGAVATNRMQSFQQMTTSNHSITALRIKFFSGMWKASSDSNHPLAAMFSNGSAYVYKNLIVKVLLYSPSFQSHSFDVPVGVFGCGFGGSSTSVVPLPLGE